MPLEFIRSSASSFERMFYTISSSRIMGHVFVSPLNWGLCHSTRDIPIIEELLRGGHEVTIGTSGNALGPPAERMPRVQLHTFKDYPAPYSDSRFFLPQFVAGIPALLRALARGGRKRLAQILVENKYDLIISDNRMGVYSSSDSQLLHLPSASLQPARLSLSFRVDDLPFNGFFHSKLNGVIVPDIDPEGGALISAASSVAPIWMPRGAGSTTPGS